MDNVYLILVVILFALAISDLIVGVSNDAVNFLNSAIGAKAAPFKIIMLVAALGILVGTTFSSGMMEVARKGIFHPEYFYFSEIMVIFLAVMITDVILLDVFNTFGMPTSTTVSLVFELLGAAVSVAIVKVNSNPEALQQIQQLIGTQDVTVGTFINTNKAVLIVSGILLSVIMSFSVGAIVQYISRLIFSFNYGKPLKYFGSLWGSFAITAITNFILVDGIKGSTYSSVKIFSNITLSDWTQQNTILILVFSFVFWAIILQVLQFLKVSILKIIILVGTFALAMAFAGNDLVNFIGVPLAGLNSYQDWVSSGQPADELLMNGLTGKVPTEYYLLILAGLVMVITLWLSKKAKTVIKTSLNLSRQDEGEEKFGSSLFARNIVRAVIKSNKHFSKITPKVVSNFLDNRFNSSHFTEKQKTEKNPPAFDMIRASVNLVVASILISIGTTFKLPLSTTYVTFMVAMGTSLSDRAWSQESAVFRITGVVSVIGGWFFTAFSAFTVAFLIALLFSITGFYGITAVLILAIYLVIKTHAFYKKRENESAKSLIPLVAEHNVMEESVNSITDTLIIISEILDNVVIGLEKQDRKHLKNINQDVIALNAQAKHLKANIYKTIVQFDKDSVKTSHYYVQVLDYLRETAHCLTYISQPSLEHIDNNFGSLLPEQIKELKDTAKNVKIYFTQIIDIITNKKYEDVAKIIDLKNSLINNVNSYRVLQIKRVKHNEAGTKNSMLYLSILHEVKNLLLNGLNLLKAQRDFSDFKKLN